MNETRNAAALRLGQMRHDNAAEPEPVERPGARCAHCGHSIEPDDRPSVKICPVCDGDDIIWTP